MNFDVPFVPNTEDDLHCLQAAWLMIAKYFMPDFEMSWDEFSKVTGFEDDKGSWASAGLLWFKDQGFWLSTLLHSTMRNLPKLAVII